jgi:hypothetical protein
LNGKRIDQLKLSPARFDTIDEISSARAVLTGNKHVLNGNAVSLEACPLVNFTALYVAWHFCWTKIIF